MRYRLICSDIDGTLVNSEGQVTKANQEAILRLKEKGIMFAICSGRMYYAASMIGLYYGLPSHVICSNGAVIANLENDQILHEVNLSSEKIHKICDVGDKYNCVIGLNTIRGVIFRGSDGIEDVLYKKANEMYGPATGRTMMIKQDSQYRKYIEQEKIAKISLWASSDDDYEKVCQEINRINGITSTTAMKWNLEITEEDVTKWHGIKWLMEKYGLQREEVVCIGDTMNDYEMVKNAGLGVAMANGDSRLKEAAAYITETNDNSGVAALIEMCLEGTI